MSDPLLWLGVLAICVCLVGIFFCSLAEAAFLGMNEARLRWLSEKRERRAQIVVRLLSDSNYLSAIIVGMNLFVIIISTVMTLLVRYRLAHQGHLIDELAHIGMVLVILLFAELTPKTYGSLYPERSSLAVAPAIAVLAAVLRPVVIILARLSRPLLRKLRGHGRNGQLMTLDEIRIAADVSEEEGMVDAEEAQMLDSVIDLGETQVRGIMVPRVDIVAAEDTTSVEEFAAVAGRSGYSRIPIYSETLDSVTGIVYINDVLRRLGTGDTSFTLTDIARPPVYVPGTKRIDDLLREMREHRVHIAIVVDDYGGTDGLVTIEDILEELVGEIADEHDVAEDQLELVCETEALVSGKMRIDELNERLCTELPEDQYETIGGLISGLAGHIPLEGEVFEVQAVQMTVEDSDGRHVKRVRVVRGAREDGDI
ncbi:MAG: hemolysin family protein [Armatimonadia bacterium]